MTSWCSGSLAATPCSDFASLCHAFMILFRRGFLLTTLSNNLYLTSLLLIALSWTVTFNVPTEAFRMFGFIIVKQIMAQC